MVLASVPPHIAAAVLRHLANRAEDDAYRDGSDLAARIMERPAGETERAQIRAALNALTDELRSVASQIEDGEIDARPTDPCPPSGEMSVVADLDFDARATALPPLAFIAGLEVAS